MSGSAWWSGLDPWGPAGLSPNELHGFPSLWVTTCREARKGWVYCALGSSQSRGPWRADPQLTKLATWTWNVTPLVGMEPKLVCEVERFQLDIVGLTSTHLGSGINPLKRGWTLFYSGIARGER